MKSNRLWDLFCFVSIVGIWPRFIEPYLLSTTKLNISGFKNLKILQLSDLHFNSKVPDFFLDKIIKKAKELSPDLIVFTGDFICNSQLEDKERIKKFLNSFHAPLGCYAILGNHDYAKSVTLNKKGQYCIQKEHVPFFKEVLRRLFFPTPKNGGFAPDLRTIEPHQELLSLLKETPFQLLHNETKQVGGFNLCGVGEFMLDRCLPQVAFEKYNPQLPGIVLAHNPDCIASLLKYPGEVILCGHTHGAQINLPFIWKRLVILEDMRYKRGLFQTEKKTIYVSRGLGSVFAFRWFSIPEMVLLENQSE